MKRLLYDKIRTRIDDKRYIIIKGPRQVGKTTIMKQLYDDLINKYQNAFFISLENPTIYNILNEHPENLFKYVTKPPEMVKDVSEKYYVFIDEIQYLENPSNFLKYNYDMYSHTLKLVVSGSSAFYIDKKFDDSLMGRKWLYNMMTLSFEEFLNFRGFDDLIPELKKMQLTGSDYSVFLNQLYVLLDEYISYGGYPAVVLEKNTDEKRNILYEITNTFVKRDVLESGIMEEEKFFCDEDLSLSRLSEALGLTRNQLSQFLNTHYKKNFNNYINAYRIEEAKKIIVEEPARQILSIALAVGFNSYSSFHSTFKKMTGHSPADFRKKYDSGFN